MSGWHALDGNMLAADAHYDGHDGCQFCGGEIKLISGNWSCQDCDWSYQEKDEDE